MCNTYKYIYTDRFRQNRFGYFFQMATSSIEYEAPDLGLGDFVLLSEITMNDFVDNLKTRFEMIYYLLFV